MEEKEFNALVAKVEEAAGQKITAEVKEALKGLELDKLKGLTEKEFITKADLSALAKSEELEGLRTLVAEATEKANQAIENGNANQYKSTQEQFAAQIAEKKDELKTISKVAGSNSEVVLKASTVRASVATSGHALDLPGIGQLNRQGMGLYDLFPKVPVGEGNHQGVIRYLDWDEATTVKAAGMVAEGTAFPESTAKFKGYTLDLRKVGDTLPVSDEFFEDEQLAAAELDLFLDANVKDKIGDQVVNGDNTGQNLKGLSSSIDAYTAAASGIADANIYDLVMKVRESITAVGTKFRPNFVAMNIADITKLKLKKDANNNYIFDRQDERIGEINIIEDNHVAANTMIVGDSRFARIYEMGGVVLSNGYTGTQFTEDMSTLKARKRLAFLIKNSDKGGFRKVASISAALTTLAT